QTSRRFESRPAARRAPMKRVRSLVLVSLSFGLALSTTACGGGGGNGPSAPTGGGSGGGAGGGAPPPPPPPPPPPSLDAQLAQLAHAAGAAPALAPPVADPNLVALGPALFFDRVL